MIINLPEKVNPKILENFHFGDIEAINDDLLTDCFKSSIKIRQFLKNKKDFLIGAKGAGKTAVLRQLYEKKNPI